MRLSLQASHAILLITFLLMKNTYESLTGAGWPEWQAKGVLELFEIFASNQAAVISPDGETLLGRPLTKLDDFLKANKAAFV